MIRNTFLFLPKVSHKKEENLYNQGIKDWDSFLKKEDIKGISKKVKPYLDRKLVEARSNLYNFNSSYFTSILAKKEHWRLYNFFKDETIYLDIETSNVNGGFVTVIGMFDGIDTKTMVKGINLDISILQKEISKHKILITFNGSTFDIPFLKKLYPGLKINIPHYDLKVACQRLNLKGGLKEVEKQLSIKRPNIIVERLHNGDPYTLWKMWRATGDDYYLNLLIEYNEEDIINLKKIADYCYQKLASLIE